MTSFIENAIAVSDQASINSEDRASEIETRCETRKHEMMVFLTEKYHGKIKESIERTAKRGLREKYMNFLYDDFKANCHGLGRPKDVQIMWLREMCDPKSFMVPVREAKEGEEGDEDGMVKDHFEGLDFNVWGNKSFTTHFTW
jgi:hypothetical protein